VPTFEELGLTGFELTGWFGVVAPAATPRDVVAKLNAAVTAALKDPEVARRIRTVGMEPTPTTPEGLTAYLEGDIAKAAKVAPVVDDKPN
jgi:tripartite-type tricarboxylate transporter receptor subunit TctC